MKIKKFFLSIFLSSLLFNMELILAIYEKDRYCEQTNFQSELNSVTQTFTPTKNNIAKIEVNLRKGRNSNFTIYIKLKDCKGKILGTSPKLNSSQMIRHSYTFEWYEFDFKPPIRVTPNQKYEINLVCEGDCGRLKIVEDQVSFTYTNNDDCDPTGHLGECEKGVPQDLSYRTFYDTEYKPKETFNLYFILIIIPVILVLFFTLRRRH